MDLEQGTTRVYNCPMCRMDTPHTVCGQRGDSYAVVCCECMGGSIVDGVDLKSRQLHWEEELQAVIERLDAEGAHDPGLQGDWNEAHPSESGRDGDHDHHTDHRHD